MFYKPKIKHVARLPDYLILGTMKGGTTVLSEFINAHMHAAAAKQKEIHYFSLNQYKGVDWYKGHFSSDTDRLTGDASPTYFDMAISSAIPKSIERLMPEVKMILIVRDPVDRAISHFSHLCHVNKIQELVDVDINDFFGRSFTNAFRQTYSLDYYLALVLSFSTYYRKYLNYLSVFNKKQLLVITNEELLKHPQNVMAKVFKFLGLCPFKSELFEKFKYSTGPSKRNISDENLLKLKDYLYPDYEVFCEKSGLEFKAVAKHLTTQHTPVNAAHDVMEGINGWLFLAGGSNNPLDYYIGKKIFSKSLIESWNKLLSDRYSKMKSRGVQYAHLFVPNKLTVYPEFSNLRLNQSSGGPIREFMREVKNLDDAKYLDCVIDATPYLTKQKIHKDLYYKTDTHWNEYGCYCAYQLLCSALGVIANKDLLSRKYSQGECVFDLGGKYTPPRKEIARFYNFISDSTRVYANEMVLHKEANSLENDGGLHVGSNVVYKNPNAENRKTVILFGDSFSEYRTSLLTAMLAETFTEMHFVWSTSIDYDYIDAVKPDIVITEIVERFMPNVPVDNFNLERYVKKKLKTS